MSALNGTITTVVGDTRYALVTSGAVILVGDGGPATQARLNNPASIALAPNRDLYIADQWNNVVRKVSASSGIIVTVAGQGTAGSGGDNGPAQLALLNSPGGVAVHPITGDVYIADNSNHVRASGRGGQGGGQGHERRVYAIQRYLRTLIQPGFRPHDD